MGKIRVHSAEETPILFEETVMKSELVIWSLSSPRGGEKWAFVTLFTTKRCTCRNRKINGMKEESKGKKKKMMKRTSYSTLCFSDSSKGFKMLQIIRAKPQSKEQSEIHKENLTRTLDQSTDPNFNTNDEPQNPRTPSTGDPLQMRRSLQGRLQRKR